MEVLLCLTARKVLLGFMAGEVLLGFIPWGIFAGVAERGVLGVRCIACKGVSGIERPILVVVLRCKAASRSLDIAARGVRYADLAVRDG